MSLLNPTEAPLGYYAVLKSDVATQALGNICRACDWRKTCQNEDTDLTLHNHRCMSYAVISAKDGREIQRNDGCGVVFKRLPTNCVFQCKPATHSNPNQATIPVAYSPAH